ncbi:trypsin-like peptidase domain-containing protein [Collinsella sp. AGMB00827]|uniref:Trypsin-like peptidase domain-containing protein n=1 Tax=Collinsella ureilytica TaxID=2869515 RepID=A0ABS7MJ42_9ACTN|nr:trypsin-like peptidase domain-containing protein [Collinsella urealyticum]MBY4797272.1 trypsin-like peptidase domain-containing protein [Collinsella urealyticum]
MNEENTSQRPSVTGSVTPHVEVETTPQTPQAPEVARGSEYRADSGAPAPPPVSPAAAGSSSASKPAVFVSDDAQPEQVAGSETVHHTVVKTRAKKLPVFIAALSGLLVGAVLVIALLMSGAFRLAGGDLKSTGTVPSLGSPQQIEIKPEDTSLAEAVATKALPSVVSISSVTEPDPTKGERGGIKASVGSGVVIDAQGNILTNYHVIEGVTSFTVTFNNGETREAEIVGSDPSSDLAVVRVKDAQNLDLVPINLGDSDGLKVGQWVMAIGNPFGNEQSVSTGIVSALYRSTALPNASGTSIYANLIQTDAAINPGNSGGALVNAKGDLIGINSVIESPSGSSAGVGFAIPINYAKNIASQIIEGKVPVHPYLGVKLSTVNALTGTSSEAIGAQVMSVEPDGPAAAAGLKRGDVITAVDDASVNSADGLIIALRERAVGDKVKLTVFRQGKIEDLEVTLGSDEALRNREQDQDAPEQGDAGNGMQEQEFLRYLERLLGR